MDQVHFYTSIFLATVIHFLYSLTMSIALLCGLLGIFSLFGYLVATRIARLQNLLSITAVTVFLGEAFYIVLLNALGYFIPIHFAFWVSLLCMVSIIALCMTLPTVPITQKPPRKILILLWVFALAAGIAYARTNASDWDSLIHYPVPATILEGNFPVQDPFNPWNRYGYHYAGMLFAASTTALTGIDLATSYALQPILSALALLFFAAAIGHVLTKSWKGAALIAILTCAGGGFHWLYGFAVLRDVYSTYILQVPLYEDHQTVLRYVSYMFGAIRAQPIVNTLEHRAVGVGVAALMASIYACYELVQAKSLRSRIVWLTCFIVWSALLALSLESAFAILFTGIFAMIVLQKIVPLPSGSICWLFGALTISLLFAAYQGGVITESLTFKGYTSPSAFELRTDGRYHYLFTESLGFWEWPFIRDAGFTLLLLPFTIVAALRSRKRLWLPILIAGIALAHMAVPFVIWMPKLANGMDRVIHTGMGLSSLLIGWWLWEHFFQSSSSLRKKIAYGIVVSMVLSTVLHLPARILLPSMKLETRSLIPKMEDRTEDERAMHEWIQENTTLDDWFFFLQSPNPKNPTHDPEFAFFATFTGRFVVKHGFTFDLLLGKDSTITLVEESCSTDALKALQIDYIAVYTDAQRAWFNQQCTIALFTPMYNEKGVTIYRFNG